MIAPRPSGAARPPRLDRVLLGAAAALLAVGLTERYAPEVGARVFADEPGVAVAGVALFTLAAIVWNTARLTAIGTRRLLARMVAVGLACAGAADLVGPVALRGADALLPLGEYPGARALAGAFAIAAIAGYAYWRSPARRR